MQSRLQNRKALLIKVFASVLFFFLITSFHFRENLCAQNGQPVVEATSQGTKPLVLYYSLTGKNKIIAEELKKQLACDIGEIKTASDRSGIWGFIVSGYENIFDKDAELQPFATDFTAYNPIIICSPIWMQKISSPARTLFKNPGLKGKDVYLFASFNGHWGEDKEAELKKNLEEHGLNVKCIYRMVIGSKTEEEIKKEITRHVEKKLMCAREATSS
jgi:flavodoxin